MSRQATRNLHVPLPDALYRRLRVEAKRLHCPATVLARTAIDRWLAEKKRLAVHRAIQAYAQEAAGSAEALDDELEAASVEHLLEAEHKAAKGRGR